MNTYDSEDIINVGCGEDISIRELSEVISSVVEYDGETIWDESKPDGTPRKVLDVSKLNAMGWKPKIALEDGIRATYKWYLEQL
jgi:GDP-L-fucose synthase